MNAGPIGTAPDDVIASLRANPVLASVSEAALAEIAELVVGRPVPRSVRP
jgi:hypothetical protein